MGGRSSLYAEIAPAAAIERHCYRARGRATLWTIARTGCLRAAQRMQGHLERAGSAGLWYFLCGDLEFYFG